MTTRLSTLALALFISLIGLLSAASSAGAVAGISVGKCEGGGGSARGDGGGGSVCIGGTFNGFTIK